MTFADELRSRKGPQIPQLTKEQKAKRLKQLGFKASVKKLKRGNHFPDSLS